MRASEPTAWVVYRMASLGRKGGHNAVCTQAEWDGMAATGLTRHALIRSHIGNEGEAERLARDLQTPPPVPAAVRPLSYSALRQAARDELARLRAAAAADPVGVIDPTSVPAGVR